MDAMQAIGPLPAMAANPAFFCDVCFNDMTGHDREPQILGCGHTYCKVCVDSLRVCPSCRSPIQTSNPNFQLMAAIEAAGADLSGLLSSWGLHGACSMVLPPQSVQLLEELPVQPGATAKVYKAKLNGQQVNIIGRPVG
jgi:hypothetical protein